MTNQQGINLRVTGTPGTPGATPYIGPNGNWWINGVDTGVSANVENIVEAGDNNEVMKYDTASGKIVGSGVFSDDEGEIRSATNSISLGLAHKMSSAGRNVVFRNLFSSQIFAPASYEVHPVNNPYPTWRAYTDGGLTTLVIEASGANVLTDPVFSVPLTGNRRVFSGTFTPSEDQDEMEFQVWVGSVAVWRAKFGPVVGGVPYTLDGMASNPYDLFDGDVTAVSIKGKVLGNMTTGRAKLSVNVRTWEVRRLLDNVDLTAVNTAISGEATLRIAGDAAQQAYTDQRALLPQTPATRTIALGTAYQSLTPTRPAWISVGVEATQTLTVAGTLNETVELRIGPDATVATGGGTAVAFWRASLTGIGVTIGMGVADRSTLVALLPVGWYFAVRRTAGTTASIVATIDQPMRP